MGGFGSPHAPVGRKPVILTRILFSINSREGNFRAFVVANSIVLIFYPTATCNFLILETGLRASRELPRQLRPVAL